MYFRKYNRLFSVAVFLADTLSLAGTFWLAYVVRANWGHLFGLDILPYISLMSSGIATLAEHACCC
jgi:hypothetical protein